MSGGLTGAHVNGESGHVADDNARDVAINGKIDTAVANSTYARTLPPPTGVTATDTATILAALAGMTAGDRLTFRGGNYSINAPLTPLAGTTIIAGRGCTITQVTQFYPVFDLLNVDNVTIGSGFTLVNASGPPSGMSVSFRGDSGYCYSAGVWFNGSGNTVGNLRIIDFAMGVYANWNNIANGVGNQIGDLEISGCNHGVLYLCQTDLRIGNIYVHDHVDSSAGVNPTHAIYGTGITTASSTNITVGDCLDVNNSTGQAFQFKYVHGLTLSTLRARNTAGLLNVIDSFDVTGGNLSSVDDAATGTSVTFQKIATRSARITLGNITVGKAVDSINPTATLECDDAYIADLVITAPRNGASVTMNEVAIRGLRVTLNSVKLRNTGTSYCRGILVGDSSYPTGDATISNLEVDGYSTLVDIDTTASGVTAIDYAPAAQRRIPFRITNYIGSISGTPAFRISRRECTVTYPIAGGSWAYPLPALETVTRLSVNDASAFTISYPTVSPYPGMCHEVAIYNNTAGALGVITWDSLYVFDTAFVPPAPGATTLVKFMFNGSAWHTV